MVSSLAVDGMALASALFVCLLLVPQIYHNHKRRSTEGLSMSMIVLWHACGAVLMSYFYYQKINFLLVIEWLCFNVESVIIDAQYMMFRPNQKFPWHTFLKYSALATAANGVLSVGMYYLFTVMPQPAVVALGGIAPSALVGLGFIPQITMIIKNKDASGFSYGVIWIDLIGCGLAIAVVVLDERGLDVGALLVYVLIVGMEVVIFFLKAFVYTKKPQVHPAGGKSSPLSPRFAASSVPQSPPQSPTSVARAVIV